MKKRNVNFEILLIFYLIILFGIGCENSSNNSAEVIRYSEEKNEFHGKIDKKTVSISFLIGLIEVENNAIRDKKMIDFGFDLGRITTKDMSEEYNGFKKSNLSNPAQDFEFIHFLGNNGKFTLQYLTNDNKNIAKLLHEIRGFGEQKSENIFLINDKKVFIKQVDSYAHPLYSFVVAH